MKKQKVVYYSDELNDEFSSAQIQPKRIDATYKYLREGFLQKITDFIVYRIVATPIAYAYCKIKFKHKIKNKKVLKKIKSGYFMYGNHTQEIADAIIPHIISGPKKPYTIVHANNVSMKFVGKFTPSLGALPLPDDITATKNFIACISKLINQKNCVVIYPEAHIWPYYTDIRPFKENSFKYPVKLNVPTYCFTNTYQKRKFSKKPKIITYVDGPFYADKTLTPKEQELDLRNQIFNCMKNRSKLNNCEYVKYIKKEN